MAQDQHYVPQTYLKWFYNSEKLLFRLWKDVPKLPKNVSTTGTGGVGYKSDFYVIKDSRQLDHYELSNTNAIEDYFSHNQENRYDALINQLLQSETSIQAAIAEEILRTLLSFKLRNAVFREALDNKNMLIEACNKQLELIKQNRDLIEKEAKANNSSYEALITALERQRDRMINNPDTATNAHNQGLLRFITGQSDVVNKTTGWLLKSTWTLLETSSEQPFITSDNPGFTLDTNGHPNNLNFFNESTFVFPISPLFALKISPNDSVGLVSSLKIIQQIVATPDIVRRLNEYTLKISHKYILGNDEYALIQAWQDSR